MIYYNPTRQARESNARVFVASMLMADAQNLLTAAYDLGLVGPGMGRVG
jgi:hypothetical protein